MGKMITDIGLLPKERQEAIRRDIENRILPQARNVFEHTQEKFPEYIKSEIGDAVQSMNKMINESQREGAIMLKISEIYVFNEERIRALEALNEELLGRNAMDLQQDRPKQQPKEDNENDCSTDISLPEELNNDNAKSIISKAIKAGLCDHNYKWLKTKSLLAYFADRASEYLKLGKGEYDGNVKTSWKPFETLFVVSGLSGAKRDYKKTGTLPDGYKDVDNLFK